MKRLPSEETESELDDLNPNKSEEIGLVAASPPRRGIRGASLTLITILGCWILTMSQDGHRDKDVELPVISETGIHPPERFFFTGGLSLAALCFFISAVYLFQFISHALSLSNSSSSFTLSTDPQSQQSQPQLQPRGGGCCGWVLRYLPWINRLNFAVGTMSCVFLFLLAVIDLGSYPLTHGTVSALFFICSVAQGGLACFILGLMRWKLSLLQGKHNALSFWVKVATWLLCIFSWIGLPVLGSFVIVLLQLGPLSRTFIHNFAAVNQYCLVTSLMFHYVSYIYELKQVYFMPSFHVHQQQP